jgi:hypothetical protein
MSSTSRRDHSALLRHAIGVAAILSTLAACGGGGGDENVVAVPLDKAVAQAAADTYTVGWNSAASLAVTDNDTATGGTAAVTIDSAPKSGTATVDGTKVTYTPAAGFFGQDSFSYKLSVGSASQSATVKLTVEASLTLQGQVTDGPIANAAVKADVGSQSFTATADANGKYSISIKSSQPGDFVTLTATGAGTQSNVVLTSLAGEVGSLASAAKDGKLASDQRAALDITHLSSAQAGLIAQAGTAPKTDAELAVALQRIGPQPTLDAAAAVKLVVDGGVAWPGSAANTRELLNSSTALAAFETALVRDKPVELEAARKSTRGDPALAKAPPTPAPGGAAVTLVYAFGDEASTSQVHVLTLRADGSGIDLLDQARAIHWTLDGQAVTVTYDQPIEQTFEFGGGVPVGDADVYYDTPFKLVRQSVKFSDIGANTNGVTLAVATTQALVIPLVNGLPQGSSPVTGGELLRRHVSVPAFKAEDFPVGTKLAGVSAALGTDSIGMPQSNQDVATFTSATELTLERTGQKGTWKIVDGKLRVDLPQAAHLYTLLGKGPQGDTRWLLQDLDANGVAKSASELGVVPYAAPTLARSFWVALLRSNAGASLGSPIFYQLRADGTAAAASRALGDGPIVFNFRRYWRQLSDGRIDMVAARDPSCVVYMPDGSPGPQPCALSQQRFWQPVAQTGGTVWVMQQGPIINSDSPSANRWSLVALTPQSN